MTLEPLPLQSMLKDYGLKPQKGLGQNFLADDTYLEKIVRAADLRREDSVLEIGAGLGSLTRHLANAAGKVIAVEIDRQLLPALKKVTRPFGNVQLIMGDFMEMKIAALPLEAGYKVVANIPYYLTSNLIRRLMEATPQPALAALTVQKEVAQRICAPAGKLSLLSLGVQVFGFPRIIFQIPKGAFFPAPKVDSALLLVDLYPAPLIPEERQNLFFMLAKAGFAQKRKMLHNALAGAPDLSHELANEMMEKTGIDPDRRAQTLTLEEWDQLTMLYAEYRQ